MIANLLHKLCLLKKLWIMKVTVVSALGTVPKSLEKIQEELDIRWRIEAILTAALLRSARILRNVLDI